MIRPKAKKHFGQHFLTNPAIAVRMVDHLHGAGRDYNDVIEIGPGKGILTQALTQKAGIRVWPVEVDRDMVAYLTQNFPEVAPRLIQRDFLTVDLKEVIGEKPVAIVGNFPYNISSQIVFKILDNVRQVPEMVGMFQKEMAERIVASPGSKTYGILSVLTASYYTPSLLFTLKPGSFNPPPKVQSAVIKLVRHSTHLPGVDEALFFRVVKSAFNQRRKMLRNSLKDFVEDIGTVLPPDFLDKRPEALAPADFQEITKALSVAKSNGKGE